MRGEKTLDWMKAHSSLGLFKLYLLLSPLIFINVKMRFAPRGHSSTICKRLSCFKVKHSLNLLYFCGSYHLQRAKEGLNTWKLSTYTSNADKLKQFYQVHTCYKEKPCLTFQVSLKVARSFFSSSLQIIHVKHSCRK